MLYTLAVILLVLWLLGFFAFHVGGGLIHLLLVIAVIVVIYQLVIGLEHHLGDPPAVAEVDELEDENGIGRAFDYLKAAAEIAEGLAAHALDPDDPAYWRAVEVELRRRAIKAV